jgi:hypothetical protein
MAKNPLIGAHFSPWHCRKNQRRRKCGLIFPFFHEEGRWERGRVLIG